MTSTLNRPTAPPARDPGYWRTAGERTLRITLGLGAAMGAYAVLRTQHTSAGKFAFTLILVAVTFASAEVIAGRGHASLAWHRASWAIVLAVTVLAPIAAAMHHDGAAAGSVHAVKFILTELFLIGVPMAGVALMWPAFAGSPLGAALTSIGKRRKKGSDAR